MPLPGEIKTGFAGPKNWPCCGMSAVATVAEVPFPIVMGFVRERFKKNMNWKGSSFLYERTAALDHFGVTYKQLPYDASDFLSMPFFARQLAEWGKTYLLDIPRHTMVFRNSNLFDQQMLKPTLWMLTKRRNAFVERVIEITNVPSRESEMEKEARELAEVF
jgi:hypothetical protein